MSGLKLAEGEWIVVCDGAKALILENVGDDKFPNIKTLEVREQPDPPTHELGSERPGRVHASNGTARSSVEQTDWHARAEQEFLTNLATDLGRLVHDGKIKALTIVAPPRALGVLREKYSHELRSVLKNEVPHDYVKKPIHEIEKLLTG